MMKSVLGLGLFWSFMLCVPALANKEVGNGGDICEKRFLAVRDDLSSWISKGGSSGLVFLPGISLERYNVSMQQRIRNASVYCTDEAVLIGSAEKTCKNFEDENGTSIIVCNVKRFLETGESDQYVLVHHEYAGLAGLETNSGQESRYPLSKQISGFLENQTVKRLVISPPARPKRFCAIDGHEDIFLGKLRALINTKIENLKKRGIDVDPTTLDYRLLIGFKSYSTDTQGKAEVWAKGGFKSRKGTAFVVRFEYYPDDIALIPHMNWRWKLKSKGFDREGNPVNGHCDMSPGWQGKGMVSFANAASGVRVGTYALGKIRLF